MQSPGFITINGIRIKVQRWKYSSHEIQVSTIIRGANLANDLLAAIQQPEVFLTLDDSTTLIGHAQLLHRRDTGEGVKAVTRLEILFRIDDSDEASPKQSTDQKLDMILEEIRSLRREVAALHEPSSPASGRLAPTKPGTTLLDFEIPMDDETE